MKNAIIYFCILLLSVFASCSKNNEVQPEQSKEKITSIESDDKSLLLELYSDHSLSVGYNEVSIRVLDLKSKQDVNLASIKFIPMMKMDLESGMKEHSSPAENPDPFSSENGLLTGAVIFSMPSSEVGSWSLRVEVKRTAQAPVETFMVPVTVAPSKQETIKHIQFTDGSKYMLTWIQPTQAKTGINALELSIHQRVNAMDFRPVDDFLLKLNTEMPSMGHGSPNNSDPKVTTNGHYKGIVNFTMSGDWRVHLDITKGNEAVNTSFELTF